MSKSSMTWTLALMTWLAAWPAAADLSEIKARGVLRVLVARQNGGIPSQSPFFATEAGSTSGFDRDVLERFAKTHGLRLEAVLVDGYDGLIPQLTAGKGDLIAGSFTNTEGRRKLVDFTVEVLPTRTIVVTRKPHPAVITVEQLRALRVGTGKGTAQRELLDHLGVSARNIDETVGIAGVPAALRSDQIAAGLLETFAALDARRRDPDLQIGMFVGTPNSLAYGVPKDAPQLLQALNKHIEAGRSSNLWYQLLTRYFGAAGPEMLSTSRK